MNFLLGNGIPMHVKQFTESRSNNFPVYIPDCFLLGKIFLASERNNM